MALFKHQNHDSFLSENAVFDFALRPNTRPTLSAKLSVTINQKAFAISTLKQLSVDKVLLGAG
jgi:hypothetical protein